MSNFRFNLFLYAVTSFFVIEFPSHAESRAQGRSDNQSQRISNGIQSGELTVKEATKVNREENRIMRVREKAGLDGKVTQKEKVKIEKLQNKASVDIYRLKHNDKVNPNNRAEQRDKKQDRRIKNGVKIGEITKGEAKQLRKEQRNIDQARNRAKADGRVTAAEKARIERLQNNASRDISGAMNNGKIRDANVPQERANRQEDRIDNGIASGELTRGEAKKLDQEQNKIQRVRENAALDGKVTAKEEARIARLQNKASADIYQQKHDAQKRRQDRPPPEFNNQRFAPEIDSLRQGHFAP